MTAIRTMSLVRNTCLPLPRPLDGGKLWKAENRKVAGACRHFGADRRAQPGRARARIGGDLSLSRRDPAAGFAEGRQPGRCVWHMTRSAGRLGAIGDEALDDAVF